ncbi:Protein ISD11 [Leucoagaricus sp. SymC.cos]|nr:Protein ISD11 [Leucoagaricus sp. SymC.cos]
MSTTAVAAPSRGAILHLYAAMLRTSRSFSSYNFRQYFVRKTKDTFRNIQLIHVFQAEEDPQRLHTMYADAVKDLNVLRRSAIVNQLYGGWRLAVEVEKRSEEVKERGDT